MPAPKVADHPEWVEAAEAAYREAQGRGGNVQDCCLAFTQKVVDLALAEVQAQASANPSAGAPPKWRWDGLSAFWEQAHQNRWATFVRAPAWFNQLQTIDQLYVGLADEWVDPPDDVTPHLALRSGACFRAAAEHACAGQLAEIFPSLRAALEHAGYALFMRRKPRTIVRWLGRSENAKARQEAREVFSAGSIRREIRAADPWLGELYKSLYEMTIDLGAHPNLDAIAANIDAIPMPGGGRHMLQIYLHADAERIKFGLARVFEASVCALCTIRLVFPERFDGDRDRALDRMRELVRANFRDQTV